jgi:2-dehydro-3-deoxyphosphogalactonate aldolase
MTTSGVSSLSTAPTLSGALRACPLIAVLRRICPDEVEGVGDALIQEGFRLIEVPLNSPDPYISIERLARRYGDRALIGAGTVMTPDEVGRVGDAGGKLIVMPHADIAVVRAARDRGFACFPGVATPTEGFAALAAGADGLKVFPAEAISPPVLRAWRGVFAKHIPLMPTGGITLQIMGEWLKAGASGFGIGGNLYVPGRSLDEIRTRARAFVAAWHAIEDDRTNAVGAAKCVTPS